MGKEVFDGGGSLAAVLGSDPGGVVCVAGGSVFVVFVIGAVVTGLTGPSAGFDELS